MERKIETVCIVDDDDIYQFTASLEIMKTELVNRVMSFSNGEKALTYFKSESNQTQFNIPDIMFLDVNMPVMDGWQFMKEYVLIKNVLPKSVIIYMVSSSVDNRDISRAHEIKEVSGYIVKPIERTRLKQIFVSVLN